MPPPKHPTRGEQPVTTGVGLAFSSPRKRRDKNKSVTVVLPLGQGAKRRRLQKELHELQAKACAALEDNSMAGPEVDLDILNVCHDDDNVCYDSNLEGHANDPSQAGLFKLPDADTAQPCPRRAFPDDNANTLYKRWAEILPTLMNPLLEFITKTTGTIIQPIASLKSVCQGECKKRVSKILCLFHDCEFFFLCAFSAQVQ